MNVKENSSAKQLYPSYAPPEYLCDVEMYLQAIPPDLGDSLYQQVKAKVLAYISELTDRQDKPVLVMLIKAGMVKRLVAEGLIRVQ